MSVNIVYWFSSLFAPATNASRLLNPWIVQRISPTSDHTGVIDAEVADTASVFRYTVAAVRRRRATLT
jgi:hypothetical protein